MYEDLISKLERARSSEIRANEQVRQLDSQASDWEERARRALALGEEDLARVAIAQRLKYLQVREELVAKLPEIQSLKIECEENLRRAIEGDSRETVVKVAGEIEKLLEKLQAARAFGDDLLVFIIEEKIEAHLKLGRQAWEVAFPDSPSRQQSPRNSESGLFGRQVVDSSNKEIDQALEQLKRQTDSL
ncbi:PspA/IM30 family protein [Cyanobium sp. Lug-B]|uniref:PspA/IM30 family protein n=1 Tax=Cyanobium sp. Lug-B TaxID=2823716 RepID=UPI0020CF019A|nr:PspA/IM30 family protein [Cyanobium sp. Lug-B]MCP9796123.1 hypothetical protein [Cyanobium sp. Lug-B]